MISDSKYVGDKREEPLVIRSVGANNCDAVITDNGVYEAQPPFTGFGKVTVIVPQEKIDAPKGWIPKNIVNGKVLNSSSFIDMTGITDIGDVAYETAYQNNLNISGNIDMSSLTTISGSRACNYMFNYCSNITGIDLSNLTVISGYSACESMCTNCTSLTDVNLSKLETISGVYGCRAMFSGCRMSNVELTSLKTISESSACSEMFSHNSSLNTVDFPVLDEVTGAGAFAYTFYNCRALRNLYFRALKSTSFGEFINQFGNMLYSVSGCTIHFPSNLDPQTGSTVISSLAGYPNFGGTYTAILFDLPATE